MKKTGKILALALAVLMLLTACGSKADPGSAASAEFSPRLDTEKAVELHAAVFFGNFEALDQVINHFNEYYPNVVITYNQVGGSDDPQFLLDNPVDIFMTSNASGYPADYCVDLLNAGLDVSAVSEEMIQANKWGGKLLSLPMGQTLKGIVVNKTLLEKEELAVPQTWSEFLSVLDALQQKGYTPIQGPEEAVASLCYNMGMAMLANDTKLLQAVNGGDASGAAKMKAVFERMTQLQEKGYFSQEVNAAYPADNYDGAIMRFFEGEVPFWVCDTEKVSGMKKRESKSESFSANPFSYEFMYAPLGDKGVYEYQEPWYGFAANKESENTDYAIEFLRFMARQDELNTLASVKGVPSVAKVTTDERYAGLNSIEKVELSAVSDGTVSSAVGKNLTKTAQALLSGELADADAAVTHFVSLCAESAS